MSVLAFVYPIAYTSPEVLSLTVAKKQLKMEDLGTFDDDIISDCIEAAIDEAESYINSNIRERKFRVSFQGWSQDHEIIKQKITSVDSITYKDEAGDSQTLSADHYELLPVDKYASIIHFKDFDNLPSLKEDINDAVSINITVGYGSGNVPKGLMQGIKLMMTDNYNIRNNRESKGYLDTARMKLEPYKYYTIPKE